MTSGLLKIAHYSTSLSRSAGGLYYSVSGLARAQRQLGADVRVFGGADAHFEGDRGQWGDVPLEFHELKAGGYGLSLKLISRLRAFSPDILHVHGIWSAGSIVGRLSTALGTNVVVSPRGMLDPWILARRPRVKAIHAALFERPMLGRAHLHALNTSEIKSAIQFMPSIENRAFVIPNGIPAADHDETESGRSGVLYLGRLHQKKQVLELMRAWANSEATHQTPLTIAGWGDKDYEREVTALAKGSGTIDFVGALYHDAKSAALRRAKFFVLPSLSEGLPMAVLEALQFGAIPIITDECNLPELFADNIALRMATDFSDFDAVMTSALAWDDATFLARSQRAKDYSERFLWSNIAQEMLNRYNTILEARG